MAYDMYSKPGISYAAAFFILIGLVGVGLILGGIASLGVWVAMTGQSLASMQKEMFNPQYAQAIRVIQVVSTFLGFFLPAYFTALILNRKPIRFMGFNFQFSWRQLLVVILMMIAVIPLVGALSEINKIIPIPASWEVVFKKWEDAYSEQVDVLARISGFGDFIYSLIVMALIPAIFEETLFRGGVQNILQRWTKNTVVTILIASILFSAIHFSYYGFLPRLAQGILLGLIFHYSGSLWLSIIAHFFNNAIIVSQIYYLTKNGKSIQEAMNEPTPLWYGLIGIVILSALFIFYKKISKVDRKKRTPIEDIAFEEKWIT